MAPLLATMLGICDLWYSVPLIIAVSAVYAATRHELMGPILKHAVRVAGWICGFMAVIFVVLEVLSWWARVG
jgi:hypothetical protein